MPNIHRITPDKKVHFKDLSTRGKDFASDREATEKEFQELRKEIDLLQESFFAEGKRKLLVLFQAMDTGGKDGTVRDVFSGVNPHGIAVTSFKAPTPEELSHDYLWRIHRAVPGNGMIGVFNRSQYEDVLVARVESLVPEEVWQARYDQINEFEKLLTNTGTTILKFFLHISEEEQKQRLEERLTERRKQWKFSLEDLKKRKDWKKYMQAYDDILERCTTHHAPWYVIPADQKWYRNYAVAKVVAHTLREIKPQFPELPAGAKNIQIQ